MAAMHSLNEEEKKYLLSLARRAIEARLKGYELPDEMPPSKQLLEKRGIFVTLMKGNELRGCIGTLKPVLSIVQAVKENALNAAFGDPRFQPVSMDELKRIGIEISILSPLREIHPSNPADDMIHMLKNGVHGLIIEKGYNRATFLPQVWEQLPTPQDFLSHLCIKAGLPQDEWKKPGMRFFVYTVDKFSDDV